MLLNILARARLRLFRFFVRESKTEKLLKSLAIEAHKQREEGNANRGFLLSSSPLLPLLPPLLPLLLSFLLSLDHFMSVVYSLPHHSLTPSSLPRFLVPSSSSLPHFLTSSLPRFLASSLPHFLVHRFHISSFPRFSLFLPISQ
jgi:hypothetical protein